MAQSGGQFLEDAFSVKQRAVFRRPGGPCSGACLSGSAGARGASRVRCGESGRDVTEGRPEGGSVRLHRWPASSSDIGERGRLIQTRADSQEWPLVWPWCHSFCFPGHVVVTKGADVPCGHTALHQISPSSAHGLELVVSVSHFAENTRIYRSLAVWPQTGPSPRLARRAPASTRASEQTKRHRGPGVSHARIRQVLCIPSCLGTCVSCRQRGRVGCGCASGVGAGDRKCADASPSQTQRSVSSVLGPGYGGSESCPRWVGRPTWKQVPQRCCSPERWVGRPRSGPAS